MNHPSAFVAALSLASLVIALPASGQQPAPAAGYLGASLDPAAAPAGEYQLDNAHASIVARLSHRGVSLSSVRFGKASADLIWNPTQLEKSSLTATVDAGSLTSPVEFQIKPMGEGFLNVAKFPEVTFASTSVRRVDATHGQIIGNVTLLGVTKPAVIDAELVGTKANNGLWAIGFSGTMKLRRSDFGNTFLNNAVGDDVTLVLDVEFLKKAKAG